MYRLKRSAANISEEHDRTKVTGRDVIETLKDLELHDWIGKIGKDNK